MSKHTSIAAAVVRTKTPLSAPAPAAEAPTPAKRGRPAGEETVPHQVRLPKAAKVQLMALRAELTERYGRNVQEQDLLRLAVDMMFERFGKPPITGAPDFLLAPPDHE
ncbi:hypothetical protein ABMY26_06290 (plasmid) [Azospirillum sp. HJ39]|uniref:hypothetical protein n=1 Tax=Azospirillum sp. HJ39 TaxID=3159496 RepID=UPI00355926E3